MSIKYLKKVITILLCIFSYVNVCFADEPSDYLGDGGIAVVGDSFAGHYVNFEPDSGVTTFSFPVGLLANNMNIVEDCINDKSIKYVLFATGLHDYVKCTTKEDYEDLIRVMAIKCKEKNKYLFLHTYMKVPEVPKNRRGYDTTVYDEVYKEVANEFENVYYIDMNDLNDVDYMQQDMMHYDVNFYDTLRTRLERIIEKIKKKEFGITSPWEGIDNRRQITIVGSDFAKSFYENEKKNGEYNMIIYPCENKMVKENVNIIMQAMNSAPKYILLFAGNADHMYQTNPVNFENIIRKFANAAVKNHKIILLPSYLKFGDVEDKKYSFAEYDRRLLKIVGAYDNVNYIDMRDYDDGNNINEENNNYNRKFYDMMFKRTNDEIRFIETNIR